MNWVFELINRYKDLISKTKEYVCTDCGYVNKRIDDNRIRAGYCTNCDHVLWNNGDTIEGDDSFNPLVIS